MRQEQMARRQVLILYQASLLAQGIESLLRKEKGLEVVGLQLGKRVAETQDANFEPDAIILDTCDLSGRAGISVLSLLHEHPKAKVICMNAEDNRLEVYRKDERIATRREELVDAIRSN